MRSFEVCLFALFVGVVHASVVVVERPMTLYSSVSPKLRIQTESEAFAGILESNVELKFTPSLKTSAYTLSIASDKVLTLTLLPGKKWANPSTTNGMTLYLTDLRLHDGDNLLAQAVEVATVIPTPTITAAEDNIIYMTGTSKLQINGTNFRDKNLDLVFDPPLELNKDYILSVKSDTMLVLTRMTSSAWRQDPGPLKLKRIDTGAGALRVDPIYGGIVVAEIQANLDMHGVTVESTPDERFYQDTGELVVLGAGFNTSINYLRFANGIRGRGVNYTTVEHTKEMLRMSLNPTSKWRANPSNLPGPLVLLAVDAGAGFVPVGPTEAKKGRTVATIFETPSVRSNKELTLFSTHSHELWLIGTGFTRQTYTTSLVFEPVLKTSGEDADVNMLVYNRTHIKLSLLAGKKWPSSSSGGASPLTVVSMNTGAGAYKMNTCVATVESDEADHISGVVVARSTLVLYQTAAIKKLVIGGTGFTMGTKLTFSPSLEKDVDYTQQFVDSTSLVLSLRKHKKWRYSEGPLLVIKMDVGGKTGMVPVGSAGAGIQVASVLEDPQIEESERIMFNSHSKRLVIRGTGFALEGTELTLSPTKRSSYEIESLEMTEMVLLLNDGHGWIDTEIEKGEFAHVFVTKIDTGAGEVVMEDEGVIIAKVEPDVDDNNCDDTCEWALDGVCDDGSGKGRYWWDDDYGGFYGYDDGQYYDYGYYYEGDDDDDGDFLAPVCDEGSDCTDCGGPPTSESKIECDNTCQWAQDGFCDDTRTSGLCGLGTDCHDCGPVGQSNFTTWDDDGWWDDDDNYWEIDDTFEYAQAGGRGESANGDGSDSNGGGGSSIFLTILEGLVYAVGAVLCGGGTYLAVNFYKNQDKIPYMLAPTNDMFEDAEIEMSNKVPITPDVTFTN